MSAEDQKAASENDDAGQRRRPAGSSWPGWLSQAPVWLLPRRGPRERLRSSPGAAPAV